MVYRISNLTSTGKVSEFIRESVILRCIRILAKEDQRKIFLLSVMQTFLGALDLLGVAAIGALGALAVSGIQSKEPGNRVGSFLAFLHLDNISFQSQSAILGISASIILIGRTLISIKITRRTLYFLGRKAAFISEELIARFLSNPLTRVQATTVQTVLYSTTKGVELVTLGIIGTIAALVSDFAVLFFLFTGLFIVDPKIAVGTLIIFAVVGIALYRKMHVKAQSLGEKQTKLAIEANEKIVQVLTSYREAVVHNRRDFYAREIGRVRLNLSDTLAELSFMPNVSKYVIETTIVLAALLMGATQFLLQDAAHAAATLSVFLAAGTRIAPAVLRIQQGSVSIRSNLGQAKPTLDLIEELVATKALPKSSDLINFEHENFDQRIELKNVSFSYSRSERKILNEINLVFDPGSLTALVGPSGAGKTTLLDVLLGILSLDSGMIQISKEDPLTAIEKWPGAISYVPQDILIINGTVRENIVMGFSPLSTPDENIWDALKKANLFEFVNSLPDKLNTQVGEMGSKISGGQRQRLGIARAMLTQPKVLVLDEATSSLDGETEAILAETLNFFKGSMTIILIAHRLSTVKNADRILYIDQGKVLAEGDFSTVRKLVPDFDQQAKSMGL
jgi:ABC-type multidrug transport system fused ATPase/permease subunit